MKIDVSPGDVLRRSIRLKQTNRTCWTQTRSDELRLARHRTFHELNSLALRNLRHRELQELQCNAIMQCNVAE